MRNKETQEEFEINIKYSELEEYLKSNPHIEQIFTKFPATGDPVRLGLRKPDEGFRDVLRNIKHRSKGSNINTF
jgi:hypothetical protein